MYPKTSYKHQLRNVQINESPTKVNVQKLQIVRWTLIEEQQLTKLNLGTKEKPLIVKVNSKLQP
jgi:hypothetical protein